ncbi:MAG: hypothetical protein NVS9B4_22360 [Candidatus Acidiferrum sp.]
MEQENSKTLNEAKPEMATPGSAAASPYELKLKRLAFAVGVAGWLVPGMGHALQKMWGRAAGCFVAVSLLMLVGVGMRGNVFTPNGDDPFSRLGYLADIGAGSFYYLARGLEANGPDVSHALGEYGTRILATAGVLNLLAALHAYEAARGRKA